MFKLSIKDKDFSIHCLFNVHFLLKKNDKNKIGTRPIEASSYMKFNYFTILELV